MSLEEFVRWVMTEHWDMVRCYCPICDLGRKNGLVATDEYLRRDDIPKSVALTARALVPYMDSFKEESPKVQG